MNYVIRYFFDPSSGACFLSKNEKAKQHFGYPIDHWELPLGENTKRFIEHLIAWFDTQLIDQIQEILTIIGQQKNLPFLKLLLQKAYLYCVKSFQIKSIVS